MEGLFIATKAQRQEEAQSVMLFVGKSHKRVLIQG